MASIDPVLPEQVVQKNLECYNNRDISRFMECFSPDITLFTFPDPEPTLQGIEAIKNFYSRLFEESPKLHSTILNRITFGNKIIDHERIVGRLGADEPLEIVVVYEVNQGKIFRLTAIRN
jgi:hypothetical protein